MLEELRSGAIHLTGLFLLSKRLTDANADALLCEARGKSRRQIEKLLAEWFPRPDAATTVTPIASGTEPDLFTCSRPGNSVPDRPRLEPLSPRSYRLELTISAELHEKIEHLLNLMSHALPNRDLAVLLERAIDQLLEVETKRRLGAGKPRKRREQKPGSRHVPVDVQGAVRARDAHQCSFVDENGRRCTEKAFLSGCARHGRNARCGAENRARDASGARGAYFGLSEMLTGLKHDYRAAVSLPAAKRTPSKS